MRIFTAFYTNSKGEKKSVSSLTPEQIAELEARRKISHPDTAPPLADCCGSADAGKGN